VQILIIFPSSIVQIHCILKDQTNPIDTTLTNDHLFMNSDFWTNSHISHRLIDQEFVQVFMWNNCSYKIPKVSALHVPIMTNKTVWSRRGTYWKSEGSAQGFKEGRGEVGVHAVFALASYWPTD